MKERFLLQFGHKTGSELKPVSQNVEARVAAGGKRLLYIGRIDSLPSGKVSHFGREKIAELLLQSFESLGERALASTKGQFVACIVDKKSVFCFRSQWCSHPIYYSEGALSNELLPVAHVDRKHDLDPDYFLRYLAQGISIPYLATETPLKGIRRLLPGYLLRISNGVVEAPRPIQTRSFPYFHDPKQKAEDIGIEIRNLLRNVVRESLEGRGERTVTCEVSGGLDSSFIASLVAEMATDVSGIFFSDPDHRSHALSEGYAKEVAREKGIRLTCLGPRDLPSPDLDVPGPYIDEPFPIFWQGIWFGRATAAHFPSSLLFAGTGSDPLFLRTTTVLPWLLRTGEFRTFFRTIKSVSENLDRSGTNLMWQSLVANLPPGLCQKLSSFSGFLPGDPFSFEDIQGIPGLEPPLWLRGEEARNSFGRYREDLRRRETSRLHLALQDDFSHLSFPGINNEPFLLQAGIQYVHPYFDSRVIEFVLGEVSWHLIHNWNIPYKGLLREAQKGTVPEAVRQRKCNEFCMNGYQNLFLRHNRDYLHELVKESSSVSEFLDPEGLRRGLEQITFGLFNANGQSFMAALSYLVWWTGFREQLRMAKSAPDKATNRSGQGRGGSDPLRTGVNT